MTATPQGPEDPRDTKGPHLVNDTEVTRPDPRPVDHRHSLPTDAAARSSQSVELSVIAGLGCNEGEK